MKQKLKQRKENTLSVRDVTTLLCVSSFGDISTSSAGSDVMQDECILFNIASKMVDYGGKIVSFVIFTAKAHHCNHKAMS